ncbi:LPS-assembly protein LptD, partial [candidate division KSB1 bacterium]|nr:LPS-assembly protein LptD [candidate division KSB1 bacterium]
YLGRQIKMVDKKVIHVSHSRFTTCDLDTAPHFHFEARRLKMIINERVIAKPVVMYIGEIPIAALPFAFFPTQKGRHSGVIIPHFGESVREGRHLRDLGYYWAPSDYFDVRTTVDFFEKSGWLLKGGVNYAVRYLLNGRLSGSLTRKNFSSGYQARRWDLNIRHNQEIDPTAKLSVNGYFVSDNSFYRDLSINLYNRLTRELRSNATFSKSWPEQKLSLSINASQVRDLQENTTQTTFPQLSFRKSQTQIFKPSRDRKRSAQSRSIRKEDKWYHYFYFSYSSNLTNSRREYLQRSATDTSKQVDSNLQMNHNINLSLTSPKKYFGFLAVNHYLDFQEDWFDKSYDYYLDTPTNQIKSKKSYGFAARHTFSYSASANTKIYGLFTPKIGDIQAIRHVITPSISFNYRPDFSDDVWGYFEEVQDTLGQFYKKDRFGGSTYAGGSKMINVSLRNLFQMKRGSAEKVKKTDLFTMDLSTGYNFQAEQYRLSDLRTSWQANPARFFSLSAGTNHSFYAWDPDTRTRIHRYLFDAGGWQKGDFLRLTTFNLNFSLRLQGKKDQTETAKKSEEELNGAPADTLTQDEDQTVLEDAFSRKGDRFVDERAFKGLNIPWRVNLTFNFYLDKSRDPNNPTKRYYLDISGAELQLTPRWRIGYSGHYDLEKQKISYHRFTIYRDLHCWEAQVDWVPSGAGKRVYFRINVKAPMLRDIKLERHAGRGSVLGY